MYKTNPIVRTDLDIRLREINGEAGRYNFTYSTYRRYHDELEDNVIDNVLLQLNEIATNFYNDEARYLDLNLISDKIIENASYSPLIVLNQNKPLDSLQYTLAKPIVYITLENGVANIDSYGLIAVNNGKKSESINLYNNPAKNKVILYSNRALLEEVKTHMENVVADELAKLVAEHNKRYANVFQYNQDTEDILSEPDEPVEPEVPTVGIEKIIEDAEKVIFKVIITGEVEDLQLPFLVSLKYVAEDTDDLNYITQVDNVVVGNLEEGSEFTITKNDTLLESVKAISVAVANVVSNNDLAVSDALHTISVGKLISNDPILSLEIVSEDETSTVVRIVSDLALDSLAYPIVANIVYTYADEADAQHITPVDSITITDIAVDNTFIINKLGTVETPVAISVSLGEVTSASTLDIDETPVVINITKAPVVVKTGSVTLEEVSADESETIVKVSVEASHIADAYPITVTLSYTYADEADAQYFTELETIVINDKDIDGEFSIAKTRPVDADVSMTVAISNVTAGYDFEIIGGGVVVTAIKAEAIPEPVVASLEVVSDEADKAVLKVVFANAPVELTEPVKVNLSYVYDDEADALYITEVPSIDITDINDTEFEIIKSGDTPDSDVVISISIESVETEDDITADETPVEIVIKA